MIKSFWAKRETEYLGFIVSSGIVRASLVKITTVKDWRLPETQKQVKSFVALCSFIVNILSISQIVRLP